MAEEKDKKVIGLYGEMRLAMELHERDWQVYRAYIDDKFDFVITKSYCTNCKKFFKETYTRTTENYTKNSDTKPRKVKAVTNLCKECEKNTLFMLVRFIQVKTSEGKTPESKNSLTTGLKNYSFHAKIRYHLADSRIFYAWIQVIDKITEKDNKEKDAIFFIFHTDDVEKFDDLSLDSYQITDNQKTSLTISNSGEVVKKGKKYNYDFFKHAKNNFDISDEIREDEKRWKIQLDKNFNSKNETKRKT
ncbi:MAG: hypothetical protein OXC92_10120 [Flavobacteriaceae bacterium]|nr:hypothetical protein [Flavobacteriaceae bacterium]